jgi:hypothetical protein
MLLPAGKRRDGTGVMVRHRSFSPALDPDLSSMLSRGASTPLSLRSSDWILLFGSIPEIVAKLAVAAFRRFEFYHPIAQAVCHADRCSVLLWRRRNHEGFYICDLIRKRL